MAGKEGFEPPRAVKPLLVFKTSPFSQTWVFAHWWSHQDLNLEPTGYEPGALTNWAIGPLRWKKVHMVAPKRVELLTFRVWTECSNQLSYSAMVERKGVEPSTSCVQGRRSSQVSYPPKKINGEEDRIWTCDRLVPNQVLYQAELLLHVFLLKHMKHFFNAF